MLTLLPGPRGTTRLRSFAAELLVALATTPALGLWLAPHRPRFSCRSGRLAMSARLCCTLALPETRLRSLDVPPPARTGATVPARP